MASTWSLLSLICLSHRSVLLAFESSSGSATVASRYFDSMKPAVSAVTQLMSVSPARSDIECAAICVEQLECRNFRFAEDSLSCAIYSSGNLGVTSGVTSFEAVGTSCPYVATIEGRSFCTIQERSSASVSFERVWTEYEAGFGDGSNFWIGLQRIHELTQLKPRTLRVRMLMFNGSEFYSEFSRFRVGNSSTKYIMNYDTYLLGQSNLASDCLSIHNGMKFSTKDRDNDGASAGVCATAYGNSGFWFNYCLTCNPNGLYPTDGEGFNSPKFVFWKCIANNYMALQSITMMVQV